MYVYDEWLDESSYYLDTWWESPAWWYCCRGLTPDVACQMSMRQQDGIHKGKLFPYQNHYVPETYAYCGKFAFNDR